MTGMSSRLILYTKEMFPIGIYLPYAAVSFLALNFVTQLLAGTQELWVTSMTLIGFLSVLGILFLMRILDEIKDYDVDRVLFPHRPVPRGDVKLSDLRTLGAVIVGSMVVLNARYQWVFLYLAATLAFGFLTLKWFFLRERMRADLILALVTHQPMTLFVNAYVIAGALYTIQSSQFRPIMILPAFIFFFPVTAWETSRKIRALGKETEYVTYSSLFGPEKAALLPLICILATVVLSLALGHILDFGLRFFIAVLLLFSLYASIVIRFILNPVEKNNIVKPATEICVTLVFLIYLVQIVSGHGISFLLWS